MVVRLLKPSTTCVGHMLLTQHCEEEWAGKQSCTWEFLPRTNQSTLKADKCRRSLNEHLTASCQLLAEQQHVLGRVPAAV